MVTGLGVARGDCLVQALITEAVAEALDEGVPRWHAWRDAKAPHVNTIVPLQHCPRVRLIEPRSCRFETNAARLASARIRRCKPSLELTPARSSEILEPAGT